ncbi:MAG: heme oxygenase [Sclerophora amabilis]|nr:MAG: heme oxygenase [Sclerophora amabilis]
MADPSIRDAANDLASPSLSDQSLSLPDEINIATRAVHTQLNRLITARLPLALPPRAPSPDLYVLGLSHFAPIYEQFESSWLALLKSSPTASYSSSHNALLARLHMPSLERSSCFQADLIHVGAPSAREAPSPALAAFLRHIKLSISERPPLILAYAWVFYMALFSGGRWIRAQLLGAGDDFWSQPADPDRLEALDSEKPNTLQGTTSRLPFSFLQFEGACDGEDIKAAFKTGIAEVEHLLSTEERECIIAEAGRIFRFCIALVDELDTIVTASSSLTRSNIADLEAERTGDEGEVNFILPTVPAKPGNRTAFLRRIQSNDIALVASTFCFSRIGLILAIVGFYAAWLVARVNGSATTVVH